MQAAQQAMQQQQQQLHAMLYGSSDDGADASNDDDSEGSWETMTGGCAATAVAAVLDVLRQPCLRLVECDKAAICTTCAAPKRLSMCLGS
jgi:hypothetical protein